MLDDSDILDDMIPPTAADEGEPPLLLAVGERSLNLVEHAIKGRMEGNPCPVAFLECENFDDDPSDAVLQCWTTDRKGNRVLLPEYQEVFGREPTAREVIDLRKEITSLIYEKYRTHLEIARALGKTDRWGKPGKAEYLAACAAAGITPLEGLEL